jgi:hypothetical protein
MGKQKAGKVPTLADLRREAAKHGATVEDDSSGHWSVFQCCTPVGKVWAATGDIHMIRVEWRDAADRASAIQAGLDDMAAGLGDCGDAECDYCRPEAGEGGEGEEVRG